MKAGLKTTVERLEGINEVLPQPAESATKMVNFTIDPRTGGWDNRIGYEKFFPNATLYHPFDDTGRIQSMYIWSTHGGARVYHIYETASLGSSTCDLKYTVGNVHPTTGGGTVDISVGRSIPLLNEPATSYAPAGRFLVMTNGYDNPIKFDGDQVTDLGWTRIPNPPTVWGVDAANAGGAQLTYMPFTGFVSTGNNSELTGMTQFYGLGDNTAGDVNAFKWKVTWVNEAGSESPVSAASAVMTWVTDSTHLFRFAVYLDDIPIGPKGTVARRIYRTKNLRESPDVGADEVYYFVEEIDNNTETNYVDFLPDAAMNKLGPSDADSVLLPTLAPRMSASFKGTLFIDGGYEDPTSLFYSKPGQPDSYEALSYFDLGNRDGGGIVGMVSFYNQLIVFRENAIDMVRGNAVSGYKVVPISEGIGTDAPGTITVIKGLGVVFLGKDGVYLINGGMDGGDTVRIEKISNGILKTINRVSLSSRPRAIAAFSHKWREWHCYFPVDGGTLPTLGLVLHLDNQQWSHREGFPVSAISTTPDGDFVFGTNTGKESGMNTWECGLFVISRKRASGYTTSDPSDDSSTIDASPPTSTYKSAWLDFGNPQKKKFIKYVYVYAMTRGNNAIPITYYMDFGDSGTSSSPVKIQRPDHPDQDVYGVGTWGAATWEEPYLTELRYPIAQSGSSRFSFEIETTNDIILLGYSVEFASNETQTIRGKRS
tara:strand:+ start:2284 stop:4413 length:2130 start_codon:yes stop_codon:yes gene_type:complete